MIIVCGEALIDMIQSEDGTHRSAPGGGPFNTARALARLGVPTAFLGHLSQDRFGSELADLLKADGASLELTTFGPEPTTIAFADVDSEGSAEYRFEVKGTSAPNLTPAMAPAAFGVDVEALAIGTLGLVLEPMASTLVELVRRERGRRLILLDPNVRLGLAPEMGYRERLQSVIAASTIVKASDSDLAWLYPDTNLDEAADLMLNEGVHLVVITLGADGAYATHRDLRLRVASPPVEVADTIGAGDSFSAALLAWLHDHGLIRQELALDETQLRGALEYACLAASITCGRDGADPPWKRELVSPSC
jgi:fructokinase